MCNYFIYLYYLFYWTIYYKLLRVLFFFFQRWSNMPFVRINLMHGEAWQFPVFLKCPLVKHTRFELDGIFLPQSTMVDIMLVSYYPR